MSALEVFVRARRYKDRAAEYYELAAQPFSEEVRARYLAIADHYMALAEGEIRTDRLMRQKRLEQMRAERGKSRRTDPAPDAGLKADHPTAQRSQEPPKLRLVEGTKPPQQQHGSSGGHSGTAQMAAQSDFTIVRAAW
jgi:hypothetical protein